MKTMNALRFNGPWDLEIVQTPRPEVVKGNQVLVRIAASTICGTDIGIIAGLYDAKRPLILGHEASGEVVEAGPDVSDVSPGDRVAIDPTYFCGQCWMCSNELPNHCEKKVGTETGVTRDGTFAEYYATEERFVHKLPDHVSYEESCLTEPLSCVLTGVNQLRLRYNLATIVAGGGPIGMLYSHALRLHGLSGAIVEVSPDRRKICESIAPDEWEVCESLDMAKTMIKTRNNLFDLVVDANGAVSGDAVRLLNRGGQLLVVGLRPKPFTVDPMLIADHSLSIIGSIDSIGTFSQAMHLIASGKIPAKQFVTHKKCLSDYQNAFALVGSDIAGKQRADTACAMKVAIIPS